jgi:ribosomal protein S18 acetylase RimI-like enzyme
MQIVSLPPEDWKEYRDLRLRALKEDPQAFSSSYADAAQFPKERWTGRLLEALEGERSWLFFARDGIKLVGMIGAFVEATAPQAATNVSVYVPAEERGKGISIRLMECILSELSKDPALKTATLSVNDTQLPAIALYKKFGFQPIRTETGQTGSGELAAEIVMQRALPYQQ